MKSTYIIIAAIVVIIIVIGGVFAYISLSAPVTPSPTPTPTPTTTPTHSPTPTPTSSPTSHPTSTPTAAPTATPTAAPTPTPTATPTPTLTPTTINGGGGTLVYPLMTSWIPSYNLLQPQISVNYNPEGSGAGIADFQGQRVDFGESDLPLQTADISGLPASTTALTIPISASAVVPAYNLKLVNGSVCQNGLNFTGTVLANIFLGSITTWNDPAIQALQSPSIAAQLPSTTIVTVHRSDGSGTMFAFTDYLSQASNTWATTIGKGKLVNWPNPGGIAVAAKGNGGVALAIIQNQNSIGPLEIAYEIQNANQISYGTVQNAAGNFILASVAAGNVQAALSAGASGIPAGNVAASWSSFSIVDNIFGNTTATTAYPITTLTYALVYQAQSSYTQGAALANFLSWVINSGQTFGPSLGYAPLPTNIVSNANATIKLISYNNTPILS